MPIDPDPHPPVLLDQQQLNTISIAELRRAHVAGGPEEGHRMRAYISLQDHLRRRPGGRADERAGTDEFAIQRAIQQVQRDRRRRDDILPRRHRIK